MSTSNDPLPIDQNRANTLNAVVWSLCILSSVFVSFRFFSRLTITRNLGWDDWSISASLVATIAFSICVSLYAANGGGRHVFYLNQTQVEQATKFNWLNQTFAIITVMISKVSVALLILRLLGPSKWRRWMLYFTSFLSILFGSLALIFIYVQCRPVKALWIPSAGKCWDLAAVNKYDLFVSSFFAFADFFLAILPISIIWNLQLNVKKKVCLALLLGMGIFASICAAIKASYLPALAAKSDITWITVDLLIWNAAEANIVIIAACTPVLRPLFISASDKVRDVSSKPSSYRHRNYELSDQTGKRAVDKSLVARARQTWGKDEWLKSDLEASMPSHNGIKRVIDMSVEYESTSDTGNLRI